MRNEATTTAAGSGPQQPQAVRPARRGGAAALHLRPHASPTRVLHRFSALPRWLGGRRMGRGEATWVVHHPHPRPPTSADALDVMSFNLLHGGVRRQLMADYFRTLEAEGRLPDVLGLQETNLTFSASLARRYGYHLVYFGREDRPGVRFLNGKAILSHYPVLEATHFTYALDEAERQLAIRRRAEKFELDPGELVEDRGTLRATLAVGRLRVDVYTLHHTLGDALLNADQVRQLTSLLRARPRRAAVVLGDFNANLNLRHEKGVAVPGRPTTSVEAYQHRYGYLATGALDAAADPTVRRALAELDALAPEVFERAPTYVLLPHHRRVTPQEAREALVAGAAEPGKDTYWRLQDIADGATLALDTLDGRIRPATGKRFDGLFATPQLVPQVVELDRSTAASDHTPLRARLRLPAGTRRPR